MNRTIRTGAIALFLVASPVLASCQPAAPAPKAAPGTAVKSTMETCTPGAQDEMIPGFGAFKMTSATSGWALAQCGVAAAPAFAGGSTIQCYWPHFQTQGIQRTSDGGRTWTDVSPPSVPNRTWHHTEFFLDATHAWVAEVSRTANACASQVTIFRTTDGGRTWQQGGTVPIKAPKATDDVFNFGPGNYMDFADLQHGWLMVVSPPAPTGGQDMAAPTTLYSTSDGGQHWGLVGANPGSAALSAVAGCRANNYMPRGAKFTSPTRGWMMVGCPAQTVLTTQDGGATWQSQPLPNCACPVYAPTFFDSTHAIITSPNAATMLATADGGTSWAQVQLPSAALRYVSFTDPSNGWVVAMEQLPKSYETAIYRTMDGGRTWSLVGRPGIATSTPTKNAYYPIISVQFVDPNVGFVALGPLVNAQRTPDIFGPQLQLVSTEDGGRSWKTVLKQVPTRPCLSQYHELGYGNNQLWPVKFATATTAWAKGGLRTTDVGGHWRDVSSPALREGASTPLYPPSYMEFYLDADHAWQAGIYGSAKTCSDHITTFATSDGGKTWQPSAPVALDLPSDFGSGTAQLGFTDSKSGWMWVPVGSGVNSHDMMGGRAPTSAYLFRTSDGGITWRRIANIDSSVNKGLAPSYPNCQQRPGQVTFSSETVGWMTITCVNSKILMTKDGGANWAVRSMPVSCECSIPLPSFVDPEHGFMQMYGGKGSTGPTFMSTSDGGASWQTLPQLPLGSTSYVMGLSFTDANNLWGLVTPPGWNKGMEAKFSLYRSKDGGQSWTLVQDNLPIGRNNAFLFADDKHGMVAQQRNATWGINTPNFVDGQDLELVVTSDGGHTWKTFKPAIGR